MADRMRLSKPEDVYYYNSDTVKRQTIATLQNTKFFQELNNLRAGSSTFVINPQQGLSDVIVGFKLPTVNTQPGATGVNGYGGLAVSKAFAYQLIKSVSYRYAGSSQYFQGSVGTFLQNLRECSNPTSRDDLVSLAGTEMKTATDFAGDNLFAYAVINLPHSGPNGSLEKSNPFPTEMLNSPIVLTLELNPIQSIFKSDAGVVGPSNAPTQLEEGYFQVRQIEAKDRGQLMTNMGPGSAYSFPLKAFYNQEVAIPLQNTAGPQPLTLTGFKSGQVRSIFFAIEDTSDTLNPFNFVLPRDVVLSYNGNVIHNLKGTSSQIFDLMATDVPSNFNNSVLTALGAGLGFTSVPKRTNYVSLPLGQIYEQLSAEHLSLAGLDINNAVMNLTVTMPVAKSTYVLKVIYSYNSVILLSNGNAEFLF